MAQHAGQSGACERCLRRSWLLGALGGTLDFCARDRGRLIALLALTDEQLLAALGGRRRQELTRNYRRFRACELPSAAGVQRVCRHDPRYPRRLCNPAGPQMLHVAGTAARPGQLAAAPVVALIGSRRASDYGRQVAAALARGLSASGVTVTAGLSDGIAAAAHAGALEASGRTVAVSPGGLGPSTAATGRSLLEHICRAGCVVAELPCGCGGRVWGEHAAERIVVGLATVTVLVEAEDRPRELAAARLAGERGGVVAAVPGRVTSALSQGSHTLLSEGAAALVRGAEDVLELLYRTGAAPARIGPPAQARPRLEPRLQELLDRVGTGADTPDKLTSEGRDAAEVLLALGELELMGALARGAGGRYLPRP